MFFMYNFHSNYYLFTFIKPFNNSYLTLYNTGDIILYNSALKLLLSIPVSIAVFREHCVSSVLDRRGQLPLHRDHHSSVCMFYSIQILLLENLAQCKENGGSQLVGRGEERRGEERRGEEGRGGEGRGGGKGGEGRERDVMKYKRGYLHYSM